MNVVMRYLPGTTCVRICWLVRDAAGPIQTRSDSLLAGLPEGHPMRPGATGYIACQKALQSVDPKFHGNAWHPVIHSDEPRAATCPECKATPQWKKAMEELALIVDQNPQTVETEV